MPEISKTWTSALRIIKSKIGDAAFSAWFGSIKIKKDKEKQGNKITLELPDPFFKELFTNNHLDLVVSTLKDLTGQEFSINLEVNPAIVKKSRKGKLKEFEHKMKESTCDQIQLNPKYTFENFVVGSSNRFTHAACMAVAENPAKNYNPLLIYGGVGLGKTHLMQAICHFVKKKNPQAAISYLSSESFTNELIQSIQRHSMDNFRKKYRSMDILLLDDIHFIAGKESTQEEFFHTFNNLHDAHKQIIISSDRLPKEITKLEERLVSRFSWGLITDVQPPDLETRVAILHKKLENEKTKIPEDVIMFLAESIKNNIRELEGALIRLTAYSSLVGMEINLHLARDILKEMLRESVKNITVDTIQKKVAGFFNLSVSEFKAKRRNKNIVLARQIAMFLARELTNLSLPEIGQNFGGKDHTTVLYAYNKIKSKVDQDPQFKQLINRLLFDIKS